MATRGVWCWVVLLTLSVGNLAASAPPGLIIENVAHGKNCSMTVSYIKDGFENGCKTAINGNTGTDYVEGNCVHSSEDILNPKWTVDLGEEYLITSIIFFARDYDPGHRMPGVTVSVDGVKVYEFQNTASSTIQLRTTIQVDPPRSGRYVTVARPDQYLLHFCEVQVLAARGNFENVALGKHCNISSVYSSSYYNNCSAAINGNTSTTYAKGNCIHTAVNDTNARWAVNLGQEYLIHRITIYAREDHNNLHRMKNVTVSLDGTTVRTIATADYAQGAKIEIPFLQLQTATAQVVTLARQVNQNSNQENRIMNFCEVQVWVCARGYYGKDCTKECSTGCQNETCDSQTGNCTCRSHWMSPTCQECANGHYNKSNDCGQLCGHCAGGRSCNENTGRCPSCAPGWIPPLCQQQCSPGSYGQNCSKKCGAGCNATSTCNTVNGTCSCRTDRWKGPMCATCARGYFNVTSDCQGRCGTGCNNTCDPDNGICNCKSGWTSPYCNVCAAGHYGVNCSNTCGQCANNSVCNQTSGHCPGSCEVPFQPPFCKLHCNDSFYGPDCKETCGHCADDEVCNKTTGYCSTCTSGWTLPLCKEKCQPGRYGQDCKELCGHCKQNSSCEHDTGHCPKAGCEDGFGGEICKHCSDSRYGPDCKETCGNCADDEVCNKSTGYCSTCTPGWTLPLCKEKCQPGRYGQHCNETCGHCKHNASCAHDTGHCPNAGCEDGFGGELCKLPQTSNSDSNVAGVAVGAVAAVVAVIVAVVVAVVLVRRRRMGNRPDSQQKSRDNDSFPDHMSLSRLSVGETRSDKPTASAKPRAAVKPQVKHSDNGDQSADHIHSNDSVSSSHAAAASSSLRGNISSSVKEETSSPSTESTTTASMNKRSNPPPIAAKPTPGSGGPVYENLALKGKTQPKKQAGNGAASPSKATRAMAPRGSRKARHDEDVLEEEEEVDGNEDLYACYSAVRSLSLLDDFQKYLLSCLAAPERLTMEFKKFPKGMPHPHAAGCQPENSSKNRFKKLCAYDKNRVILRRPNGDTCSDYINASYIKGHENEKGYIATQGPRANTISDLWWMVWQEGITQIIMLTNLNEGGKDKCEEYWPAVGKEVTYDHVTVRSQEEEERADFVIRTFILKVKGVKTKGSGRQREVYQYHYKAWPDHGVPAAGSLVNFWRYVTARADTTAPPLVHCSAGVGRTGTYIALDIALNRKADGLEISVSDIVCELREQRSIMVQTEVQYKFLHEVILEAYTSRDTRLNVEQLDVEFPSDIDVNKPNERIDNEFKLLKEMKQWAKPHHTTAELEENQNKNRDPNFLPDDDHLAYLSVYVRGRSQYINAVFMSSFKVRRGLLLTQLPLPDTLVDLWRLVEGCEVNTIVSLGSKDEHRTVKDYCRYWPRLVGEVLETGPYVIKLTASAILNDSLTTFDMIVQSKDGRRGVKVLHYTDWSGDLPGSISDLIHLVDTLKTTTNNDASPVVVQCLDGATRSGLFCVLYDVISRMTYDEEVDVFPTVRYVHSVRPQAVTLESQYRFCYKVAQEFQRNRTVYANM